MPNSSKHQAVFESARTRRTARRRLLAAGAALAASPLFALPGYSRATTTSLRVLSFRHTHTGEVLSLAYATATSTWRAHSRASIGFCATFATANRGAIDPQLLDQLHTLSPR